MATRIGVNGPEALLTLLIANKQLLQLIYGQIVYAYLMHTCFGKSYSSCHFHILSAQMAV